MHKRVFSGIKPSGDVHIGNYIGAIKNWVESQNDFDNVFCIVDLHAITVPQDAKMLKEKTRELAGLLLAAGIDLNKSSLFVQSHISAHSELAWILNCFIPMGWMERMTQFKEKSEGKKGRVSVGLFDYPALMAADILLYDTDAVPVGEDQKQHVELTRDVAEKFNSLYGETFKVPEAMVPKAGARVMGLQNPLKKMSKSSASSADRGGGEKNVIALLDSPEDIKLKIASAATDSLKEIKFDKERSGIYNLLVIYEAFASLSRQEIERKFECKGYAEFKNELTEVVVEKLSFIQKRFKEIMADPAYIEKVFKDNADKLRPIAEKTLKNVKKKVGLG